MTNPDIVDVQFALAGQRIPCDHADALWLALCERLPWLAAEPLVGVHPLAGLSPGEDCWYLSRRSRLTLRLAAERAPEARALVGATLTFGDTALQVGAAMQRPLRAVPVLYAKFVSYGGATDVPIGEAAFHDACRAELADLGMSPRLFCGKARQARTVAGLISGFSLMLLDLSEEHNLTIQRLGLGGERQRGCGIFVPHKSMAAAGTLE